MDFNKFQTEFLSKLKSKNKKCLESIESNKTLIQENLGENADTEVIKNFVKELNEVIVENDDHLINIIIEGTHEISEDNNKNKNIKKEILEVLTNPSYKLKNIKFNSQFTNKYTEEIQKYILPYANNYFPEYSSRSSMESDKKLIYQRNETTAMSAKVIFIEIGEFFLKFSITVLILLILKFINVF
ncbi:hypothetical protein H8356DRAFT_1069975 [Neocallimastix lanati (nom. inval.)]|nr:hypothetical protein H8356DRAFT_1069975 [Neocallimastix sp. JGI-2020a]